MARDYTTLKIDPLMEDSTVALTARVDMLIGTLHDGLNAWLQDTTGGDDRKAEPLLQEIVNRGGFAAIAGSSRSSLGSSSGSSTTPPSYSPQQNTDPLDLLTEGERLAVQAVRHNTLSINPLTGMPVEQEDAMREVRNYENLLTTIGSALGVGMITGDTVFNYHDRVMTELRKLKAAGTKPNDCEKLLVRLATVVGLTRNPGESEQTLVDRMVVMIEKITNERETAQKALDKANEQTEQSVLDAVAKHMGFKPKQGNETMDDYNARLANELRRVKARADGPTTPPAPRPAPRPATPTPVSTPASSAPQPAPPPVKPTWKDRAKATVDKAKATGGGI